MPRLIRFFVPALVAAILATGTLAAADLTEGMKKGSPSIKGVNALGFGPAGILFVGDAPSATIFAIDTGDNPKEPARGAIKVKGLDTKIADMLGTEAKQIQIRNVVVNPASGKAYVAVMRGQGPKATPMIVRVDSKGKIEEVQLKDVNYSKAVLPNPPDPKKRGFRGVPLRMLSITKVAYVDGKVYVSGLSNEEWASKLRTIPFPFKEADKGASVQIFHGAHGGFETNAPIRTFVPYEIDGKAHILAAYTCTPLVKFAVEDLKAGKRVKGTTIAELGNRNAPLDIIVYNKGKKDYLLIANSSRGLMKVTTEGIDKIKGITKRVSGTAGLTYETIKELTGIVQLDLLDKNNALVLIRTKDGALNLDTIPLP